MASSGSQPPIILFYYPFSPWAKKITAYLAFRGIPFVTCEQPVTMPRPNLQELGVKYRRIPLMSLGRDIYCDTLLILEKLESLYPGNTITGRTPSEKALEKLLEKWTDVVVFKYAAAAIPTSISVLRDDKFIKDRTELWGRSWKPDHQDSLRAEGLANLRAQMDFLENSILGDGRKWVQGNEGPLMADIHAAWIFEWLEEMDGALPKEIFNKEQFPRTVDWIERYRAAVKDIKEKTANLNSELGGDEAVKQILAGGFGDKDLGVDPLDPTGLKAGDKVVGYPTDTGFEHKDEGTLVGLTKTEAVIASKYQKDGVEVRVHHPRWQFIVRKAGGEANGAA